MRSAKELYAQDPDVMEYIDRFVEACAEVNRLCILGGGDGTELLQIFIQFAGLCQAGRYVEPPTQMATYQSKEYGQLRVVQQNGEPWFIGKDVAKALGYKDTKSALQDHVDAEDKQLLQRGQITTVANAAGGAKRHPSDSAQWIHSYQRKRPVLAHSFQQAGWREEV